MTLQRPYKSNNSEFLWIASRYSNFSNFFNLRFISAQCGSAQLSNAIVLFCIFALPGIAAVLFCAFISNEICLPYAVS